MSAYILNIHELSLGHSRAVVQAGRSRLVTKQRQHVSLICMSLGFAIVGSTIDVSLKLLGGESKERNGRAESHSGLIIFRRGGGAGEDIHRHTHKLPTRRRGWACVACLQPRKHGAREYRGQHCSAEGERR